MAQQGERRRHQRFPLGLPVRVQVDGLPKAITAELADVSQEGCLLKAPGNDIAMGAAVAFGFVMPKQQIVLARGRVVRCDAEGSFALELDQKNEQFRRFLADISGLVILAA
jgi:hypothetical protein